MEILKSYDGKARNYTGLNYNAAQGVSSLEKCCLHKVTESLSHSCHCIFLVLQPPIRSLTFIHTFIHSFCIYLPNTGDMKINNTQTLPSICSLSTREEKHSIHSLHNIKRAITEVTRSKRRGQEFCPESSQQEAAQPHIAMCQTEIRQHLRQNKGYLVIRARET